MVQCPGAGCPGTPGSREDRDVSVCLGAGVAFGGAGGGDAVRPRYVRCGPLLPGSARSYMGRVVVLCTARSYVDLRGRTLPRQVVP